MTPELERAYEVIAAHDKAENAKRVAEARRLVGRFFRVAFDATLPREQKVYRCAAITDVDASGYPCGSILDITVRQGAVYDLPMLFSPPMSGWTEINADEFRRLAALAHDP